MRKQQIGNIHLQKKNERIKNRANIKIPVNTGIKNLSRGKHER